MAELVVEPDVEGLLIGHVKAELAARGESVRVGTKVPNPRPAECITLVRTGGTRRTKVSAEPLISVEARAATETRAFDLCALVVAIVEAADGLVLDGHQVYGASLAGGIANLPDPLTTDPRYTALLAVHLRSTILA